MHGKSVNSSLNRVPSFMYDEEPKFPFSATQNACRIEYLKGGLSNMQAMRCSLKRISKSGAVIEIPGGIDIPDSVTIQIPDAGDERIGCVRVLSHPPTRRDGKVAIRFRFLRMLSERELAGVIGNSTLANSGRPRALDYLI